MPTRYEPDPDSPRFHWPTFWRALKTRDGKLAAAEAALLILVCVVTFWMFADAIRTGSIQSLLTALLLCAMSFWPALRHRLRHGDWHH